MIFIAGAIRSPRAVEVAIAPTYRSVSQQSAVVRAQLTDELLIVLQLAARNVYVPVVRSTRTSSGRVERWNSGTAGWRNRRARPLHSRLRGCPYRNRRVLQKFYTVL
eukprot:COSAG02_NODE_8591_length_2511_cov_9.911277_1_plen_107_part_00